MLVVGADELEIRIASHAVGAEGGVEDTELRPWVGRPDLDVLSRTERTALRSATYMLASRVTTRDAAGIILVPRTDRARRPRPPSPARRSACAPRATAP